MASGAWAVVVAVPAFVALFMRVRRYYEHAATDLGIGTIPERPEGRRTVVIVPVTSVSRLTRYALAEALSMGDEVVAVSVVVDEGAFGRHDAESLEHDWTRWDPGVPLRVLHTEFASIVDPIVAFIDEARQHHRQQVVVLIPVIIPTRLRYTILHNHIDQVLSRALRTRTDVVVARVAMPIEPPSSERPSLPATGERRRRDGP
jgi:hypothetical protein